MPKYRILLAFILLISICAGESDNITYQNYGLSFEIPQNWSISKVEQLNSTQDDGSPINDTMIVLSDGRSSIRIDIMEMPQMPWILSFYEKDDVKFPWFIETFYRKQVIGSGDCYDEGYSSGDHNIGLPANPDGVTRAGFLVCNNHQAAKWTIAWAKYDYINKFIGIYSIFEGDYPIETDIKEGYPEESRRMQKPLYEILRTFTTNSAPSENKKIDLTQKMSTQRQETAKDYMHDLENGNTEDKRNAIDALRELKDPKAIDPLIEALNYTNDDYGSTSVRQSAAWALAAINNTKAIDPLILALKDEDWPVRGAAAESLGRMGDKRAVEPVISVLKDENNNSRAWAAWSLGSLGDIRSVDPLIESLKDEDRHVRIESAWSLGMIGDVRAIDPLIFALKDRDDEVRRSASFALGLIGPRAVDPLIKALRSGDNKVLKGASWALGYIADPVAIDPLIQALNHTRYNMTDLESKENKEARGVAAEALGKIGDTKAVEPLISALRDPFSVEVRSSAAESLGEIGDLRAIDPLHRSLKDESISIRISAAEALKKLEKK